MGAEERTGAGSRASSPCGPGESAHQSLSEDFGDLLFATDAEGRLTYISRQVSRYGRNAVELEAAGLLDLPVSEDRPRVEGDLRGALGSRAVVTTHFRLRTRSGEERWIEGRLVSIRDEAGGLTGVTGVLRDATARRQAELLRRQVSAMGECTDVLDAMADAVILLERTGQVTYANSAFLRLTGAMATELAGHDAAGFVGTLFDPSCADALRSALASLREGVVPPVVRLILARRTGERVPVDCRMSMLRGGDGEPVGAVAVLHDMAAFEKVEQDLRNANMLLSRTLQELKRTHQQVMQHERLSAVGQMASGIAHSFNNSLTPVLGFSELLLRRPEILQNRERALGMIQDIHAAARDASETIRRLRDFYRPPEAVDGAPVDMNRVIQTVLTLTRPRWKEEMAARGATIEVVSELGELPLVRGHEDRLREALANLVLNAVDAMPGGGRLSLRSSCGHGRIVVEVADTGTGMSEEVRRRCFEPFFTTKPRHGTGMGLSVAYGIARQHGGDLEVRSEAGAGATFTLSLPVAPVGEAQAPLVRRPAVRPPPRRILVIDDELWSRNVLAALLGGDGHTVSLAENGARGLAEFRSHSFDVVIADRAMADMSGDQVALAVKEARPGTPVILVTGFGDIMRTSGERPPGVDVVLPKPVSIEELRDALGTVHGPSPGSGPSSAPPAPSRAPSG